jgi:predicted small metal-binding protein
MRKVADCRQFPSESNCSLTISGTEEEVVRAAAEHAASVHGHADTAELREEVRAMLADESPAGRYGTVMIATLTGSIDELQQATREWAEKRDVAGFIADEILLSDDGKTIVTPVFFASKDEYAKLADDPQQDTWWSTRMAPHLSDVKWIDGTWQEAVTRQPAHS